MRLTTVIWLGAATVSVPPAALARQAETVPAELMQLLLQTGVTRGDFELHVGGVPEGFPAGVLPEATRVGAAAIAARGITVVGMLPVTPRDGIAGHEQRLTGLGWTVVSPSRQAFARGPEQSTSVCRGTEFVALTLLPREAGGMYVRAVHTRDDRRPCVARPSMSLPDVVIPTLLPPPGVRVEARSGGGSFDEHRWTVRLHTDMPARDVLEHYARQLAEAGWRIRGREEMSGTAIAQVEGATSAGLPVTGLLIITPIGGEDAPVLDAFLRFVRNDF
jgi:hypothetical protein